MSTGILALWNDCEPAHRASYESWYAEEHLPERLGLPGFLRGRRYLALDGAPQFFTYYEVATPEVLIDPVYLKRVNNPTPRTKFIMGEAFRNMSRTICQVTAREGRMRGAWAVTRTLTFDVTAPDLAELIQTPGVARAEQWVEADLSAPAENAETRLRGGDVTVAGCLFVETLRREDAEDLAAEIPGARVWQFLCELEAEPGG